MNKPLTAEECFARAEVYEDCADNLTVMWTDDPVIVKAGRQVEATLRVRARKWRAKGRKRVGSLFATAQE